MTPTEEKLARKLGFRIYEYKGKWLKQSIVDSSLGQEATDWEVVLWRKCLELTEDSKVDESTIQTFQSHCMKKEDKILGLIKQQRECGGGSAKEFHRLHCGIAIPLYAAIVDGSPAIPSKEVILDAVYEFAEAYASSRLAAQGGYDVEQISAAVHEKWMETKRANGVTSRKSESGEELMVPYEQLSEKAKDLDRGSVKAVLDVLPSAATLRAEVERLIAELNALTEPCLECKGTGGVDSGGVTPWMEPIDVKCHVCDGKGRVGKDLRLAAVLSQAQQALRWISVNERMPNSLRTVIVAYHEEGQPDQADAAYWDGTRWMESAHSELDEVQVYAWREVPLPPEAALPSDAPEAAK